jgi:hypothetical protein
MLEQLMRIRKKYAVFVLVLTVLLSAGLATFTASGQVTGGDGFISEDDNTTRVVDFRVATSTVPVGEDFEVEVVVANYGTKTKNIDLDTQIRNVDTNGNIGGTVSSDVIQSKEPKGEYSITLKPGEHRKYSYLLEFNRTGRYAVRMVDTSSPVDTLPKAQKFINASRRGSSFEGSLFVDRDKIDTEFIDIGRFKDSNSLDSDIPSSTMDIPPVETNDRNEIVDSDVAVGKLESFQDIVTNEDVSGSINPGGGDLNIGLSTSTESESRHYGLRLSYTTNNINEDNLEVKVVNSLGKEVDEDTDYKLSATTSSSVKVQNIHLSSEEVQHIRSQNGVNIVFEGDNVGSGAINTYETTLVSSNDIFQLPEPELSATVTAQPNTGTVGDRVTITAQIENTGSASAYRQFRLYEENVLDGENAVKISERKVVNPGGTNEFTFVYELQESGQHEFRVLDATATVDVKGGGLFGINPVITATPQTVTTDAPTEFSIASVNSTKVDENVKEFRWYFGDPETVYKTISNPNSPADATVDYAFSTEGSKEVFLEYDYKDDGRTETFRRSTIIDVIGGPEPNVTAYYSDFGTIESRKPLSVTGSVTGIISATSCQLECGGDFVLYEDYPVTNGINMLVLDRNNTSLSYSQTFYGTYEVGEANGDYSTTTSFESSDLDQMRDELSSGTAGSPSQQLLSDIQEYRNGDEDRIFIFTSAGNPQPAGVRTDIYNELTDLGANLDGGHTSGNVIQKNAIWFFATQQTGGGGIPIYERYVPPTVSNPSLTQNVELRDVEVQTSGTVPVGRKLYLSAENTKLAGTIEDATINWNNRGDGTQDTGMRTGVTYESAGTKQVKVTVEDVYGSEGTATFEYVSGSRPPNATISSSDLVIGENNFIDSASSYDSDGSIQSYVWIINDGDVLSGQNPSYSWSKIGENKVRLEVTDRFGNTDSVTKNVFVSPEPPEPKADIDRLPVSFDERPNTPYYIRQEPITHHTLDDVSDGFSADIWGGFSGVVGSEVRSDSGLSNGGANFSATNDIVSIRHSDSMNTSYLTLSAWIKPQSVSGQSSLISKSGSFDFRISNGNLLFITDGATSYQTSDVSISENNWTHVAVSYSKSDDVSFMVNGELVERLPSSGGITFSQRRLVLGNNNQGYSYSGVMDGFRMYDESLGSTDVLSIAARESKIQSDRVQNVFYNFGEERYSITSSSGDVSKRPNRVVLSTDSSSGTNSTSSIKTESIDLTHYDEIKVTYDFEAQRQDTIGNPVTGRVSVSVPSANSVEDIVGHRSGSRSGIISLDVSSVTGQSQVTISSQTFGSNRGTSSLQVFEIWGESSSRYERNRTNLFSSNYYPSDVEGVEFVESRTGIMTLSNALPEGEIVEIDVKNNNSEVLRNHQVEINVQHRSGMSDNFSDLKFFDESGIELDHWVQNYSSGTSATVWVEVSEIESNDVETLSMLYNSESYSNTSSGSETFRYFDEFNSNTSSDWSTTELNIPASGERFIWQPSQSRVATDVSGSSWYSIYGETRFDDSLDTDGFVAQARVRNDASNAVGVALETEGGSNYNPYATIASSGYAGLQTTLDEALVGVASESTSLGLNRYGPVIGGSSSIPNYHTLGIIYNGGSGIMSSYDGVVQDSTYTESDLGVDGVGILSFRNNDASYYDWFIVRKYAEKPLKVVDKRNREGGDSARGLAVGDLSSSVGDTRLRYSVGVPNNSVAGINVFSGNQYNFNGSVGATTSVYCQGLETTPSCTDTGSPDGEVILPQEGSVGLSTEMSEQGVQTTSMLKAVSDGGTEYTTVVLDATESVASGDGNRIVEYEWDLDGGRFDTDLVGEEVQITLPDGVDTSVELRVRDITGAENTTTIQVPVTNEKPEVDLSIPETTSVGEDTFLSASVSDDNAKQISYIFDTGDKIVADPTESVVKEFVTDGEVEITAVAVDEFGQTGSDSKVISVQSEPPVVEGVSDSLTANVRDTVVFDTTGDVTNLEDVPRSITEVFDASDVTNPNGGQLQYRWVFPNGETKTGNIVRYVPQNKTGSQDSMTVEMYVTNSIGQTAKKTINLTTINKGPKIENFTVNENYGQSSSLFVESSTCDSTGYCGSRIQYSGNDVSGGLANDGILGINMLVINRDNEPTFFGAYNVEAAGGTGGYSTAKEFDSDGTPVSIQNVSCESCATPNLTEEIDKYKNEPNVRIVLFGEGQPMPDGAQGGKTVTRTEAELYNEIESLGGTLNSTSVSDDPGLVTDNYSVDFEGGTRGWQSDASTLTQKDSDWIAPQCSPERTTRIENTELIDVGQSSIENTIDYSARMAAVDGWDNEELVFQLRYDGSWHEVERHNPVGSNLLSEQGDTYDNPSASGLGCPEFEGTEDGPVDVVTFNGQVTVSGKITGARVIMDDSNSLDGIDKDYLESFAIDYVRFSQKDYVGAGLQENDMWILHTQNDRDGQQVSLYEDWERRGSISGVDAISDSFDMTRNTTINRDKINMTVEAYVPHPRIGGNLTVRADDGTVYTDQLAPEDIDGHTYTFNHTVRLNDTEVESLPADYKITAEVVDDYNDTAEKSTNLSVGASGPNAEIVANKTNAVRGEDIRLSGEESTDPQNSNLTYEWEFGDSASATGEVVEHSYSGSVQNRTVSLTVTNEFGQTNTETVEIAVVKEPTVDDIQLLEQDRDTATGNITVDATAYGKNNEIVEYRFYPGDQTGPINVTDPYYVRNYSVGGAVTAEVVVVDKYGQTARGSVTDRIGVPVSCSIINQYNSNADSKTYTIDPDRDGDDVTAYCDMSYDGGGWTAVDPETAREFIGDVGGGIEVATGGAATGYVDDGHQYDSSNPDRKIYPYSVDGNGGHGMKYIIQAGFEFDEIHLNNMAIGHGSYIANSFDTSEVRGSNTLQGDWQGFNSGGVSGDIAFGSRTEVVNSWSSEFGGMSNYKTGCQSCSRTFSDGNQIYSVSTTSTAAVGWGESGGQREGWVWKGGSMYLR